MQYTKLGSTDIEVSKLCLGCMSFGKAGTMHGWTPFSVMENHYNLLYREDERELIPICRQMNVSLITAPLQADILPAQPGSPTPSEAKTDNVVKGKYDRTEQQDIHIVHRAAELAEKYGCKISQIAVAWEWKMGVAAPIVGATKSKYLDDAAGALDIALTDEDMAYLEELYVPHPIVGAIDKNPPQGTILVDEKSNEKSNGRN